MTTTNIHFITGGQRSGKSEYAEKLTLNTSNTPTYLATSRIWDEGLKRRIDIHKARRGSNWTTEEIEVYISRVESSSGVVLLDCITLWLANIYHDTNFDGSRTIAFAKAEWKALISKGFQLFVVSNETGLGQVPSDQKSRVFIDIQGTINQYIAKMANRVTLVVSGIPVEVK